MRWWATFLILPYTSETTGTCVHTCKWLHLFRQICSMWLFRLCPLTVSSIRGEKQDQERASGELWELWIIPIVCCSLGLKWLPSALKQQSSRELWMNRAEVFQAQSLLPAQKTICVHVRNWRSIEWIISECGPKTSSGLRVSWQQ